MSIRVMSRVWDDPDLTNQSDVLVMLAIADFSNDAGYAWPGVESIAKKSRHTDRGVQKILARLEAAGKLKIKRGGGPSGSTSTYQIIQPKTGEPCSGVGVNGKTRGVNAEVKRGERGGSSGSPDPSGSVIRDPSKGSGELFKELGKVEKVIRSKELEEVIRKISLIKDSYGDHQTMSDWDRDKIKDLAKRRRELKEELGYKL